MSKFLTRITRQPQVHIFRHLILYCQHMNVSLYPLISCTCRGGNVCSSSLTQKTKTQFELPQESKLPLVHPASSSQKEKKKKTPKNDNIRKIHQQKYNDIGKRVKHKKKNQQTCELSCKKSITLKRHRALKTIPLCFPLERKEAQSKIEGFSFFLFFSFFVDR